MFDKRFSQFFQTPSASAGGVLYAEENGWEHFVFDLVEKADALEPGA